VTTARRLAGLPLAVPLIIGGAWLLALVAQASGGGALLHHDSLLEGGLPWLAALALFLLAWQAMIAAMMLPSSLPLVRLFTTAARGQRHPSAVVAAFLAGYAVVWSVFGAAALAGDVGVHRLVAAWSWLAERPWLIEGSTLALAGAFQFSSLKDECLRQCRHPGAFLLRFYERGLGGALRLGLRHGLFCLGCCWALMLVTFAVGVANLWWMAALTALMVWEKTARGGERGVPRAGVALLASAALVLAQPIWLA
jgi:predicted metal-binding membrane protein